MKKALFSVLGVGLFLAPFSYVQAVNILFDEPYSDETGTFSGSVSQYYGKAQGGGSAIVDNGTQTLTHIRVKMNYLTGQDPDTQFSIQLTDINSSNTFIGCGTATTTGTALGIPTQGSSPYDYEYVDFYFSGAGCTLDYGGASGENYPDGFFYFRVYTNSGFSSSVYGFVGDNVTYGRPYMIGDTDVETPDYTLSTTTRIYPPYTPDVGDLEPDNTVTFSFNFFHNTAPGNTVYEKLGVQVVNNTQGYTYDTSSLETDILSSGSIAFSDDYALPTGDAFSWRGYARKGTTYVYGPWIPFSVVEEYEGSNPFSSYPDDITATSTAEFGFMSTMVSFIESKPPFAWFMQINEALNGLSPEASTTPTLTLDTSGDVFGSILQGTSSVALLSEATLSRYIPDNVHTTFLTLQLLLFYLTAGMYMLRRTFSFFQPQQ